MNYQKILLQYFKFKIRLLAIISKEWAGNEAFKTFCTPYQRFKYKEEQMTNAEKIRFRFGGLSIIGHRWNSGASKKALIVHGFRSASINFKHYADQLAQNGYQVYAFDAPAHGLSKGNSLNALSYKNFVKAIMNQYGPFDSYLAHSFGGLAVALNLEEVMDNRHIKTVLLAPAANTKQLCEDFLKFVQIKDATVIKFFYKNIETISGKDVEWFHINRAAQKIKGPVLWIHDYTDKITPITDALNLQKQEFPNFHFLFTENLGHRRIYRDENVIRTIIKFLE